MCGQANSMKTIEKSYSADGMLPSGHVFGGLGIAGRP